jgi:hypothetical protein
MKDARGDNKTLSRRDAGNAMDQILRGIDTLASPLSQQSFATSSYHVGVYTSLRKEVLTALKSCKKCEHCGAFSPKLRHDSSNKIFQQACEALLEVVRDRSRLTTHRIHCLRLFPLVNSVKVTATAQLGRKYTN